MLRSLKELKGYQLKVEDGELGRCHDFLIDDGSWAVRYMVADTRKWLPGRKVVISPIALGDPDWESHTFPIRLTREQVLGAPSLAEHAPVTRQYEVWYHKHYNWPYYWGGADLWSSGIHPSSLFASRPDLGEEGPELENPHLHALSDMIGYNIAAKDGGLGHLEDFIVDDDIWAVQYAVVTTRHWLAGKRVLVPLTRLEAVAWDSGELVVDLTRQAIRECPEYSPWQPVNREYEERLYDYVGRPQERRREKSEKS